MPSIAGITWDRLETDQSITYPCTSKTDPGQPVIFTESFPTENGLARFVPSTFSNANELPDNEFNFILITFLN